MHPSEVSIYSKGAVVQVQKHLKNCAKILTDAFIKVFINHNGKIMRFLMLSVVAHRKM